MQHIDSFRSGPQRCPYAGHPAGAACQGAVPAVAGHIGGRRSARFVKRKLRHRQHGLPIHEMHHLRCGHSAIIDPEVVHPSVEIRIGGPLGAPDPVLRGGSQSGRFKGHRSIAAYLNTVNVEDACRAVQGDGHMMPAPGRQRRQSVNDLFS